MANKWTYIVLILFAINVIGTLAGEGGGWGRRRDSSEDCDDDDEYNRKHHPHGHHGHHGHHDDDDDRHGKHHGWHWTRGAGMGVLIVIILVICGLLSLVSWLSCKIYTKCRAKKVDDLKPKGEPTTVPPFWASQLVFQPEMSVGFGLISDGLARVGPAHLICKKEGNRETHGATWAVPMTKGKHVFEITWPWAHRGSHASVGVGTSEAPIKGKGSHPLVGANAHSWGLDIVSRKTRHANRPVTDCPSDGSFVPDKFLVYVDADEGTLAFGNEVTYWGVVLSGLPKKPLHLMIGASRYQAEIAVQYMGSAVDGENDMAKQQPPHHLPPLATGLRAPPVYTEVEETEAPIMVKPAAPGPEEEAGAPVEKPTTPPPPYMHPHPVGYNTPSDGNGAGLV